MVCQVIPQPLFKGLAVNGWLYPFHFRLQPDAAFPHDALPFGPSRLEMDFQNKKGHQGHQQLRLIAHVIDCYRVRYVVQFGKARLLQQGIGNNKPPIGLLAG